MAALGLAAALGAASTTPLQAAPPPPLSAPAQRAIPAPALPPDCMGTWALRAGMTGYGLTVFQGDRIEKFSVTILGVMKNAEPQCDMILARLGGPLIDRSGVAEGMSGSPVFINGKIVGAVSGGWLAGKEPICVVTPIGAMLATGQGPVRTSRVIPDAIGAVKPMATPLFIAGVPAGVIARYEKQFKAHGFLPLQGGQSGGQSGGQPEGQRESQPGSHAPPVKGITGSALTSAGATPPSRSPELIPGASLCSLLVQGDVSMFATGTLTYRQGDRLYGYGHPLFGLGPTHIPLAPGYVHVIFPSYIIPFKIAGAGEAAGILDFDGEHGIVGRLGGAARTIPLSVAIASRTGEAVHHYAFQVTPCGELTSLLMLMVIDACLSREVREQGEQTVFSKTTITPRDHAPIVLEHASTSRVGHGEAAVAVAEPVVQLMMNAFAPVDIDRIDVELRACDEFREARIDAVRLAKLELEPGEEAEVAVALAPFSGAREIERLKLKVPDDAAPGTGRLFVGDALQARARAMAKDPGLYQPRDLPGIYALLQHERSKDRVYMQLEMGREGLSRAGVELPLLPGSALAVLGTQMESGFKRLAADEEVSAPTPWVVVGGETLSFHIKERKVP